MRMKLQLKRVYDSPARTDGARILVDRLWPRGLSKDKVKIDHWLKDLAPSDGLRKWFAHDPEKWQEFKTSYHRELDANAEAVKKLRALLRAKRVTLLFGAKDAEHNNAVALSEYLQPKKRKGRQGNSGY